MSSKGPTNTSPHSASVDILKSRLKVLGIKIKVLGEQVRRSSSIQHSCLGSVHANVLGQSEQTVVKHLAVQTWVSVTEVFPYSCILPLTNTTCCSAFFYNSLPCKWLCRLLLSRDFLPILYREFSENPKILKLMDTFSTFCLFT